MPRGTQRAWRLALPVLQRSGHWIQRRLRHAAERRRDEAEGTFFKGKDECVGQVARRLRWPVGGLEDRECVCPPEVVKLWREHRFDLLGSGWVRVRHGMACRGLEGHCYRPEAPVEADPEGAWLVGRVNGSNRAEARRVWRLIGETTAGEEYIPIDWQLDFKSGYRWSERTWYRDIEYGGIPGADIKVPWELGRMQHLLQFGWAYGAAKAGASGYGNAEAFRREFRNQILDFIACNPPRFGVQWACTMDVAIRVSNWLVAYDLLRSRGASFDEGFERVFRRSVYEHGRHIVENLEWGNRLRHNHYLANVAGLLFVGAYLEANSKADLWLAFAAEELLCEVREQFHEDGSNFEGSVCYHTLSGEMALYATALLAGLSADRLSGLDRLSPREAFRCMGSGPACVKFYRKKVSGISNRDNMLVAGSDAALFPEWYLKRLEGAGEFTMQVTKPDGRVVQIGDNDSGRFLKAASVFRRMPVGEARRRYANLTEWREFRDEEECWIEEHLDHRDFVGGVGWLFGRKDLLRFASASGNDGCRAVVQGLAGGRSFQSSAGRGASRRVGVDCMVVGAGEPKGIANGIESSAEYVRQTVIIVPEKRGGADRSLLEGMRRHAYRQFGLYLFQSDRLFLAVRCGPVGRRGQGGHSHNDQLHVELTIDGVDWFRDPGTYVYSSLPERRNEYRSVKAHFVPGDGSAEPSPLDRGLFALPDRANAEVVRFSENLFLGRHYGFGEAVSRRVEIDGDCVEVSDWLPKTAFPKAEERELVMKVSPRKEIAFSPGYGWLEKQ